MKRLGVPQNRYRTELEAHQKKLKYHWETAFTSRLISGVMAILVGNAIAKPINHAPANLWINSLVQPINTEVIVKVIVVSNITTMRRAVMKKEYLDLIFNVDNQPAKRLNAQNIIVLQILEKLN
jgi:hypothetical protein